MHVGDLSTGCHSCQMPVCLPEVSNGGVEPSDIPWLGSGSKQNDAATNISDSDSDLGFGMLRQQSPYFNPP